MSAWVRQWEHTCRPIAGRKKHFMHKWRDWGVHSSTQCGSTNGIIECPAGDIKQLDTSPFTKTQENPQTHTFQCCRVGCAVTFPRPSAFSFSSRESKSELALSIVERRLSAVAFSKGSKLLCLLAGGVRGDGFAVLFGGSVGRRTAGT